MWIHIPEMTTCYLSAQESGCLTLDTDSLTEMLERSAMLRSKRSRKQSWYRALKTASWMMPLYGQTLKPSMATRGVKLWIQSLADSRVSPSPTQEEKKEQKTQDIYGPTLPNLSKKYNPLSASLKMSMDFYQPSLLTGDMPTRLSTKTYKDWATKLRRDYSLRKKLALLTKESDYSSWPTASVGTTGGAVGLGGGQGNRAKFKKSMELMESNVQWRTPNSQEPQVSADRLDGELGHRMYDSRTGRLAQVGLTQQIQKWRTPDANMGNRGQKSQESYEDSLQNGTHAVNLNDQVQHLWSTPRASSANGASQNEIENGNPKERLETQVILWPTPTAVDYKGANVEKGLTRKDGKTRMDRLANASVYSLQVQNPQNSGEKFLKETKRLNPRFSEWLMGWIPGWTHPSIPISKTVYEQWEMESYQLLLQRLTLYFPEEFQGNNMR